MTSQRVERTWIRTGGYGRIGGEWVKKDSSWVVAFVVGVLLLVDGVVGALLLVASVAAVVVLAVRGKAKGKLLVN